MTTPACAAWRARPAGITPSWCAVSPKSRCAKRRAPRLRVSSSLRPVGRAQRARLEQLTAATGLFRPAEIAVAAELLDDSLAGDDYHRPPGAYGTHAPGRLACSGPAPRAHRTNAPLWIR